MGGGVTDGEAPGILILGGVADGEAPGILIFGGEGVGVATGSRMGFSAGDASKTAAGDLRSRRVKGEAVGVGVGSACRVSATAVKAPNDKVMILRFIGLLFPE